MRNSQDVSFHYSKRIGVSLALGPWTLQEFNSVLTIAYEQPLLEYTCARRCISPHKLPFCCVSNCVEESKEAETGCTKWLEGKPRAYSISKARIRTEKSKTMRSLKRRMKKDIPLTKNSGIYIKMNMTLFFFIQQEHRKQTTSCWRNSNNQLYI